MSNDRDPVLEALFEKTRPEISENEFVETVMARVDKRRRNVMIGRVLIIALILLIEFLPSSPLQNSVGKMAQSLGTELVTLDTAWWAFIVAPVNSIAGIVGMFMLGLHVLYRRNMR